MDLQMQLIDQSQIDLEKMTVKEEMIVSGIVKVTVMIETCHDLQVWPSLKKKAT